MSSTAQQVEEYVERRPYVQESLADEIVNYSALARQIEEEIDGSFEAVKMALRRLTEDLKKERRERRRNIGRVMDGTSVELKNNMKVCKSSEYSESEVMARTQNGYTVIQRAGFECSGEVIEDQVMITLKSSGSLEDTPGVLAYILSIIASRNINLTEVISCREDTHIVIDEEDATEAFELLNDKLT